MARNSIYLELEGQLEKSISLLAVGSMLPSEQKLAEYYKVSKPTLRRALSNLAQRGLIHTSHGVGHVVCSTTRIFSRELIFLCHDVVFFAKFIHSFSRRAEQFNYFSSIVPLSGDQLSQERILETVISRKPAGVIIYASPEIPVLDGFSQFESNGIPTVYLVRRPPGVAGNRLELGNEKALSMIVQHFYNRECRKFALFGDAQSNILAAREREAGFLDGLRRCRLKRREAWICTSPERQEDFLGLFAHPDSAPDAVCCFNDIDVANFIHEMQVRNFDFSRLMISGFDKIDFIKFLPRPDITVQVPMHDSGIAAADMLIRTIENPAFSYTEQSIEPTLIFMNRAAMEPQHE